MYEDVSSQPSLSHDISSQNRTKIRNLDDGDDDGGGDSSGGG